MTIRLMVNSTCSNKCSYCFVRSQSNFKEMIFNEEKFLESLSKIQGGDFEIVGGEPLQSPDLIKIISKIPHDEVPITLFTSGIFNKTEIEKVFESFPNKKFNVYVSYDGKMSDRNFHNWKKVYDSTLFLRGFPNINLNIRWSITRKDITFLFDTFLELMSLNFPSPIFFPMKTEDFLKEEIEMFLFNWNRILRECKRLGFNFLDILNTQQTYFAFGGKSQFKCGEEVTILPSGQFSNCYVLYSSSEFDPRFLYTSFEDYKENYNRYRAPSHQRCKTCLEMFRNCNKCPGNLMQYQKSTGKENNESYCDLINAISKEYIKFKLMEVYPGAHFSFSDETILIKRVGDSIKEYRMQEFL